MKIKVGMECFLMVDITIKTSAKERLKGVNGLIKKGEVVHVVDIFTENGAVVLAFRWKGKIQEVGFGGLGIADTLEDLEEMSMSLITPKVRGDNVVYKSISPNGAVTTHEFKNKNK